MKSQVYFKLSSWWIRHVISELEVRRWIGRKRNDDLAPWIPDHHVSLYHKVCDFFHGAT